MTRTALIVGAGIGGLSAAISLRGAGWNVRVFERASSVRELGFALLVAPNAMAALRELAVADVVLARGIAPTRGEARRMDGTILKRADSPSPEVMGGGGHRRGRPAGRRGRRRVGDSPGAPSVRATTAVERSHRGARGGADGAGHHLDGLSGIHYQGSGVESFVVRASDTGIYWALSLAEELVPAGMRHDPAAILRQMLPRFEEMFRGVTAEPPTCASTSSSTATAALLGSGRRHAARGCGPPGAPAHRPGRGAGDGGRGGARTGTRQERARRGRVVIVRT